MIESIKNLTKTTRVRVMTNDDRPKDAEGNVDWVAFDRMRENFSICVDHDAEMISFKMLTKPIGEGGNVNLCQWTDLVEVGLHQLKYLNNRFPCRENSITMTKLEEALMWQKERTRKRIERNVEGQNKL